MNFEERIIDLETKISFQDKIIEDLNEALYLQQQRLAQVEKNLEIFQQKINAEINGDGEIRPNEKPPHY